MSSQTCNFVLLQFYYSWFLVQFVKTPRVVFREQGLVFQACWLARRHHPHSLNPYRSPRPQLHQENLYGKHGSWSNPWVPVKVQELQNSPVALQRRSQTMEIVLHPPWYNWRLRSSRSWVSSLKYPWIEEATTRTVCQQSRKLIENRRTPPKMVFCIHVLSVESCWG